MCGNKSGGCGGACGCGGSCGDDEPAVAVQACPDTAHMGKFACTDKSQCWEPCGCLGKSDDAVKVAPEHFQLAI